jgi:tripartite-type tricarboxylate transporter receptor subunit TctC
MFMRVNRLAIVASVIGSFALASPVAAQDNYPVDTVTLVTHSSPGGGSDVYLREMINFLAPTMGAEFAVENVRGGSGAKAIAKVATSPADGSIFYAATPTYINMSLLSNPEYSYRDVEPIVNFFLDPQVIYVRKDSKYTSLTDVIADAKASPGAQKWGTGTPAALERQALEKFKKLAGVDVTIVTHDGGGDMMINVLNGSLDLGIGEVQEFKGQLDAGEVRVIGVFTENRLPDFPDAKTAKEEGIDMVVNKFRGIVAPKGVPAEVIAAWEAAIPKVMADPEFQKWYKAANLIPAFMPHAEYVPFIENVAQEQGEFFKEYGITQMD